MEDSDWTPVVDLERNVERYFQWSSSVEEEQLRVISYEAAKLSSERDVSQVRFVTVMGYDQNPTIYVQLWDIFSDFGPIRTIRMGERSTEIEYEHAASAHEAVATDIDLYGKLYGKRLVVIFSEYYVMRCPIVGNPV